MQIVKLPVTRYYGSKRKLANKIFNHLEASGIEFDSMLDVFGGSGSMAYFAKRMGKAVIYNDIFKFNYYIGRTLIQENHISLTLDELLSLLERQSGIEYKSTISDLYGGIYYTDEENAQIDLVVQNIERLESENKRSIAFYILFQSCLIKRPYNLFHRNNLNLRINFSGGNFGNKVTWERSFVELFQKFHNELQEFVFDNGRNNLAVNFSALNCPLTADLVYIDPPYFQKKNHVAYHSKYHLLEGLANYNMIDTSVNSITRNKEIQISKSKEFESRVHFLDHLTTLLNNHPNAAFAISYRSNGIPSIEEIVDNVSTVRAQVNAINLGNYGYALNRNNEDNFEYLITATN